MLTGVLCIYIVLVMLFKGFVQPATILPRWCCRCRGPSGAVHHPNRAVDAVDDRLVMLMGIATKNSILLIDYVILARRDHGLSRWDALLDACRKRPGQS